MKWVKCSNCDKELFQRHDNHIHFLMDNLSCRECENKMLNGTNLLDIKTLHLVNSHSEDLLIQSTKGVRFELVDGDTLKIMLFNENLDDTVLRVLNKEVD